MTTDHMPLDAVAKFRLSDKRYESNIGYFNSLGWQRMNARRLEFLAAMGLLPMGSSVLEVGAGIGDLTTAFLDRGNSVLATDARQELVATIERRLQGEPGLTAAQVDLDDPPSEGIPQAEVVFCFGVLYHVVDPARTIAWLASRCAGTLLLESHVDFEDREGVQHYDEDPNSLSLALSGRGCAPARGWVMEELKKHFPCVYMPESQPAHDQYPTDWDGVHPSTKYTRAIFVASREPIDDARLLKKVPRVQSTL